MSRERTEQGNSMTHGETIDCLIDEHKRLKERVRYLEEIELLWGKLVTYHQNKQKEAEDANEPYRHENKRLREALEFYADEKNYEVTGEKTYIGHGDFTEETWIEVDLDRGKIARLALEVNE